MSTETILVDVADEQREDAARKKAAIFRGIADNLRTHASLLEQLAEMTDGEPETLVGGAHEH